MARRRPSTTTLLLDPGDVANHSVILTIAWHRAVRRATADEASQPSVSWPYSPVLHAWLSLQGVITRPAETTAGQAGCMAGEGAAPGYQPTHAGQQLFCPKFHTQVEQREPHIVARAAAPRHHTRGTLHTRCEPTLPLPLPATPQSSATPTPTGWRALVPLRGGPAPPHASKRCWKRFGAPGAAPASSTCLLCCCCHVVILGATTRARKPWYDSSSRRATCVPREAAGVKRGCGVMVHNEGVALWVWVGIEAYTGRACVALPPPPAPPLRLRVGHSHTWHGCNQPTRCVPPSPPR